MEGVSRGAARDPPAYQNLSLNDEPSDSTSDHLLSLLQPDAKVTASPTRFKWKNGWHPFKRRYNAGYGY